MSKSIRRRFRADVRRTGVFWVLGGLGVATAMIGCAERANSTPTAAAPPSPLPTPPQQHAPWTPPMGLPAPLIAATGTLFDEGMADPRGGEYRTITVQYGDPRLPDMGRETAHGWVLPTGTAGGQRFAVCWNGLVYPVVSVGDAADLAADVQALVNGGGMNSPFASQDTSDWNALKETTPSPLKVCYLLRLGQGDLAQKLDAAQKEPQTALLKRLHMPVPPPGTGAPKDPYLMLATVWTSSLVDRAVRTHQSGDDTLSLADLQELTTIQPVIEAEAARRGATEGVGGGVHTAGQPYFGFLASVPRLLADETRRVAEPQAPPDLAAIRAMPDKTARIAALIQALDQVSVQQFSNPGGVEPDGDPIVAALIDQGDDAVQTLIDTVKNDPRLTRSVGWGHGQQPGSPVSVAGAAFAALVDILHTSKFSAAPDDMYDRAKTAAALQAYWDRNKGLPLTERWYRMLADDTAGQAQWLEAAHEIVRPQGERVRGGWIESAPRTTDKPLLLSGEALRQGHTPSVAALMARRVYSLNVLAAANGNSSLQVNDVDDANTMALCLAIWDPQAARLILRSQFQTERKTRDAWNGKIDLTQDTRTLVNMTLARMQIGDPNALADYADWIRGAAIKTLPEFDFSDVFEPLWRVPTDPVSLQTAEYLFTDPHSPWVPLIQDRAGLYGDTFGNLLESPLIRLPAFRAQMLAALADRTVVQTVTLGGPDRNVDFAITHNLPDPDRPSSPTAFPVRRCDLYAWHLSHIGGMPAFGYDWPAARKDAAVAEAAPRLRRYGPSLSVALTPIFPGVIPGEGGRRTAPPALLPIEGGTSINTPAPYLQFPHLDHPATAQDVAEDRAIFSLGARASVAKVPAFPLAARWVTAHGKQDGTVWQGEETGAGGRFYGFVGPHDITGVPAAQIEFPAADIWDWISVGPGLDCALCDASDHPYAGPQILPVGQPLSLSVRLRSRRGVPQSVPADFLHAAPSGPSLRQGVSVTVLYSADASASNREELFQVASDKRRAWTALAPRRLFSVFETAQTRSLAPTEEFTAFTFDPHAWFDLSRPGIYRLKIAFGAGILGPDSATSRELVFQQTLPNP